MAEPSNGKSKVQHCDFYLREDMDAYKLATLRNAVERSDRGTLSAANSTPLTDGAAAVLLASEDWAKARGLPIQAYLTTYQTAANNFVVGEGLLMAPTIAVSKMLERAGLSLQDFDFSEIHEAFAAQVLCNIAALEDAGVTMRPSPARLGELMEERLKEAGLPA